MRVAARHSHGEATDVTALPHRRGRRVLTAAERRAGRDMIFGQILIDHPGQWSAFELAQIFGASERTVQYAGSKARALAGRHLRTADAD